MSYATFTTIYHFPCNRKCVRIYQTDQTKVLLTKGSCGHLIAYLRSTGRPAALVHHNFNLASCVIWHENYRASAHSKIRQVVYSHEVDQADILNRLGIMKFFIFFDFDERHLFELQKNVKNVKKWIYIFKLEMSRVYDK